MSLLAVDVDAPLFFDGFSVSVLVLSLLFFLSLSLRGCGVLFDIVRPVCRWLQFVFFSLLSIVHWYLLYLFGFYFRIQGLLDFFFFSLLAVFFPTVVC